MAGEPGRTRLTRDPDRLRRIIEAAFLFYHDGKTKSEIAETLLVSNTEVQRLLDEAQRERYVRITIHPPTLLGLERDLRESWKTLKGAIVIPSHDDYAFQRELIGRAAAEYLEKRLKEKPAITRIAVSGGQTMWDMANSVTSIDEPVEIVPTALIGRGGPIDHADPNSVVTHLFEKGKKVTARFATVLPLEQSVSENIDKARAEQQKYRNRAKIKDVSERMRKADLVMSGVGFVPAEPSAAGVGKGYQTPAINFLDEIGITAEFLRAKGAVGDINYSFFTKTGAPIADLDVFISLTVSDLKQMVSENREVVLVAAKKAPALRAALRGGLCSFVITDQQTAMQLVE
jgi:DNA-binding transcriptional regulator LsrR (DeoR family)